MEEKEVKEKTLEEQYNEKRESDRRDCALEVQAVMNKYRCRLVALPVVRPDGTLTASVDISLV